MILSNPEMHKNEMRINLVFRSFLKKWITMTARETVKIATNHLTVASRFKKLLHVSLADLEKV